MHLRPATPIAHATSPFGQDLLDRHVLVELLARTLGDAAGPAVLSVNGRWGDGKTTFLEMLDAHLQERDRKVVFLRATQHCSGQHPARAFLAAATAPLSSLRPPADAPSPSDASADAANISGDDSEDPVYIASADPDQQLIDTFHDLLGYVALSAKGPLFVLVDEFERCSPAAVVDMVDVMRHAFAVPGVIVVLATNHDELETRIRQHLGTGTDAAAMLAACIDASLDLPPLRPHHLLPLAEFALSVSDSPANPTLPSADLLAASHRHWNLTPRDVGRIALRISAVLDHAAPPNWFVPPSPDRDTYAAPLTVIAALHSTNRPLFDAMFRQPINAHAAAFSILSAATPSRDLEELVAILLTVALRDANTTEDAFAYDCQAAGFTDPVRIGQLHRALNDRQQNIGLDRKQLGKLTTAFDFSV